MTKHRFWGTTAIYTIGFLGLRALSFILLPLYTNLLTTHEAGILFIIYTVLAFLNTVYNRGMDSALLKFFNETSENSIISTSILYSFSYGIIISILCLAFYYFSYSLEFVILNPSYVYIGFILVAILFCDMLSSRCMHIVRLKNKPWYYLCVSLINVILSLALNVYFIVHLKLGLDGAILALLYVSIIQLFILSPILYNKISFRSFDKTLLSKMKRFSLPFLPAAIFFILIELSDRWFIGLLSQNSTADVGLYGAGYKIGSIMLLMVRGFNLSWQPFYLKENESLDSIHRFSTIGTDFINIMICLGALILMLYPVLLQTQIFGIFLIGENFWPGLSIIPIIILSYICYGIFVLQMPSLYIKNKHDWAPILWGIGFAVNCIFNVVLIPNYGFMGAAISTFIAYFVMMVLIMYKNYTWMKIAYDLKSILIMFVITCLLYLIYSLSVSNTYAVYFLPILCILYIIWTVKFMISKKNALL